MKKKSIPMIADVDVAIMGGSLSGIASALQSRKQGKKVIIIEPRTYLGTELTASIRPWISVDKQELENLPDLLREIVEICGRRVEDSVKSYVIFHVDLLKRHLEERLATEKIKLLYASLPTDILRGHNRRQQLMIANKSGQQVIECETIVDTSETAITAFLKNQPVNYDAEKAFYRCTIEFDHVRLTESLPELNVKEALGVKGNKLSIYEGFHGEAHYYVSFEMELPAKNNLKSNRLRETEAKKTAMAITTYLVQHHKAFNKALLCAISNELEGPFPLDEKPAEDPEKMAFHSTHVVSFFYDFYRNHQKKWLNPVYAVRRAELLAKQDEIAYEILPGNYRMEPFLWDRDEINIPGNLLNQVSESIPVKQEITVHYRQKTEVLVAGGGSSGGLAAITAAKEGRNTTLVDLNPGLGGTGTFGGVDSYWFGHVRGFAGTLEDMVNALEQEIHFRGGKWNVEAKKHTLLSTANEVNTNLMFNSILFGTKMDQNRVTGVMAATKWGVYMISSECVIDATGDGDIAAFSGAKYTYGSEKDHVVMWYSLPQYKKPGRLQNNFTSMVNVEDIEDYTRAILVGRQRNSGHDCYDHGIYVATRESRHVKGDVTMTIIDQLLHRTWSDVINIHFSNHDMKGVNQADWLNIGFIPPNLEIEIPYRMLLPKGLEGILVAGKAISATHDAFPAIRMQADLENLGAFCGIAAAKAVQTNRTPRQLDVKELQRRMIEEGLLPESVLDREPTAIHYSEADMMALIEQIETDKPLHEYSRMKMDEIYETIIPFVEICTVGPKIVPLLQEAHCEAGGIRKIRLAQALAFYEDPSAVPTLIKEINRMIGDGPLPKRTADILYVTTPPDHGAMPDVCYLLYSLGMTNTKEILPILGKVVDRISDDPMDYEDKMWGMFYYVHAVSFAAERISGPELIPILEKMHGKAPIHHQHCLGGIQPNYYLERRSMLELAVGRALARCGSRLGYQILTNYLKDVRSLLRKQAYKQLQDITGQDFKLESEKWMEWARNHESSLPVKPFLQRADLTYRNEEITRRKLPRFVSQEETI